MNGIAYIEHEESYTSKASFLDNDPIPVYDKERKKKAKAKKGDTISVSESVPEQKYVFSVTY